MADDREQWHLDKRVPITIIGAIVFQTVFFTYVGTAWKTDVESRLHVLEKSDDSRMTHENRIIILEQGVLRIRDDLSEIKQLIRAQKLGELDDPAQTQPQQQ